MLKFLILNAFFVLLIVEKAISLDSEIKTESVCPELGPYCKCEQSEVVLCENFDNFGQLSLKEYNVTDLQLRPSKYTLLDKEFNLNALYLSGSMDIYIAYLKGIDYRSDLVEKKDFKVQFTFSNSSFDFYTDNQKLIDETNCDFDLVNDDFRNIFHSAENIILEACMFKNKVCPVVFKNANVTLITLELLTNENVLDFIDISNRSSSSSSNRDLNSHVKFFFINLSEFYLKASLLNPMVFSRLESLTIEFSTLQAVKSLEIFELVFVQHG